MTERLIDTQQGRADPIELHARIREAILRGDLEPRSQISQVKLAREYGVNRTPLREALRMLQREGLVESERNRKMRVAGFSVTDMEQLYAARIALEALAVRIAVQKMDDADRGRLKGDLAQMRYFAELDDHEQWETAHRAFHARLVAGAGDRLVRMVRELTDQCERYCRFYSRRAPGRWGVDLAEHQRIIDACDDPDAAAAAVTEHLAGVLRGMIALVDPEYETKELDAVLAVAGTAIDPHF